MYDAHSVSKATKIFFITAFEVPDMPVLVTQFLQLQTFTMLCFPISTYISRDD